MLDKKGFTLIELMVVILIVAILAAVAIPILRGRIESAKWSEGAAMAGTIKTAVKVAYAEDPTATLTGILASPANTLTTLLGFGDDDLTGQYFTAGCFTVQGVDAAGNARIDVTAGSGGLVGTGTLWNTTAGWMYYPPTTP